MEARLRVAEIDAVWREIATRRAAPEADIEPPVADEVECRCIFGEANRIVLNRTRIIDEYSGGIDSYGSLYRVFKDFQRVASECDEVLRRADPVIGAYEPLTEALCNLKEFVDSEARIRKEFLNRAGGPNAPLPREASFNVLVIAELLVRLADIPGSESFAGDTEYEYRIGVVGGLPVWPSDE